jgi:hypothetical protein
VVAGDRRVVAYLGVSKTNAELRMKEIRLSLVRRSTFSVRRSFLILKIVFVGGAFPMATGRGFTGISLPHLIRPHEKLLQVSCAEGGGQGGVGGGPALR